MNGIEILAPAGGMEQLIAAVRCGADAVYLGMGGFNARRNAENFSGDGLTEAVSYSHGRGAEVHVTLNTLVYDDEIETLEREIDRAAEAGVDAVIIQDPAVLRIVRNRYPAIKRHASTQMTIHNTDGAKLMRDMGFDRVVLSRELSLREIEKICSSVDIETEVFIHGALCMSCSGGCYLSSMLGGRSGNRGLCAQPCRLNFRSGKREYALSLKDMSHIQYLKELSDMGVRSAKIEGRKKRPEYVAAAVTACRKSLNGEEYDVDALQAVFSRSGFTDGYATGKRDLTMFGYRRREDVTAQTGVLNELANLYRKERQSVPVDMSFGMKVGATVVLTVSDGERTVTAEGAVPETAKNRPTDSETAEKNLSKTGGTPFCLNGFTAEIDPGLMLPVSELNSLRRDALGKLLTDRERIAPHKRADYELPRMPGHDAGELTLRGRFTRAEQVPEGDALEKIILPATEVFKNPYLLEKYGDRLICELPTLLFPENEDSFREKLKISAKKGLKYVLANNLYGVGLGRELGLELYGGYGLNVINSHSAGTMKELGVRDVILSWELQMKRAASLGGEIPRGMIVYGRLPLMSFRNCPVKTQKGCAGCDGGRHLVDRKGIEFPVNCQDRMYSVLYNSVPLALDRDRVRNVDFAVLYFTDESRGECERVTKAFISGEKMADKYTNGLYFREVK